MRGISDRKRQFEGEIERERMRGRGREKKKENKQILGGVFEMSSSYSVAVESSFA